MEISVYEFIKSKSYKFSFWLKGSIYFFYIAAILGQIHLAWSEMLSNFFFLLMFFFLFIGNFIYFKCYAFDEKFGDEVLQMAFIFLMITAFWNTGMVVSSGPIKMSIALIGGGVLNLTFIEYAYFSIRYFCKKNKDLFEKIKRNIPMLVLLLIFSVLFIQNFGIWFKIDSYTFYHWIEENIGKWNFTLNDMHPFAMGEHLAYAYAVLLYIGESFWHNMGNGVRAINLIMSLCTIAAFYKVFLFFMRSKNRVEATLVTGIFAFAPLFFGISYLMSTDFPLLCFFVMFVYADLYNKKILKFLFILAVCFSKEIGIFSLAGYYVGECIPYGVTTKKWNVFWRKVFNKKNIFMYSPCILFTIILVIGDNGWSKVVRDLLKVEKESTLKNIVTYWHYPVYKMIEMFFMNFAWIIVVFSIIAKWKSRNKKVSFNYKIIPILISYMAFILSGMAFFTYVYYRYVQLGLFFHTLLLGLLICDFLYSENVKRICLTLIVCLYFIESYQVIDPLMNFLPFRQVNVGNNQLLSTRKYFYGGKAFGYAYIEGADSLMADFYLSGGMEYNRTCIGLQKLMEKVIKNINYDSTKLLVMDNFGGWIENTNGQLFGVMEADGYFWDVVHETVTRDNTGVPMNIALGEFVIDEAAYKEIYYFDFVFNPYHRDNFLEYHQVKEAYEENFGIWKVNVYRVK